MAECPLVLGACEHSSGPTPSVVGRRKSVLLTSTRPRLFAAHHSRPSAAIDIQSLVDFICVTSYIAYRNIGVPFAYLAHLRGFHSRFNPAGGHDGGPDHMALFR